MLRFSRAVCANGQLLDELASLYALCATEKADTPARNLASTDGWMVSESCSILIAPWNCARSLDALAALYMLLPWPSAYCAMVLLSAPGAAAARSRMAATLSS